MQTENRFFDDLARLATGAVGSLSGLRQEIETRVREQFERLMSRMDLVTREEFDAVQAMAAKARLEQEAMAVRLEALERKLGIETPAPFSGASSSAGSPSTSTDPFVHRAADSPFDPAGTVEVSGAGEVSPGIV